MDNQKKKTEEYKQGEEIDLYQLIIDTWKNLRHMWWMPVVLAVVGAVGLFGFQYVLQTPMYESSATFTVATETGSAGNYSFYYDNSTADQMAKTFPYILESSYFRSVLSDQLEDGTINGTITAETISNSNVVTMRAHSSDPGDAYDILTAAIEIYPETAQFVLGKIDFEMLSEPAVASEPYNQSGKVRSILLGAGAGIFVAIVICGLLALFIKNVRSTEEMKKITSVRCLAHIPKVRFKARGKSGDVRVSLLNKGLSSEYSESIRVLLTRILSSMDRNHAKVLLVTSTIAGEEEQGYIPVIAHPERYECVKKDWELALEGCKKGAKFQINKSSLSGTHGEKAARCATCLLDMDLVDFIASDAHHVWERGSGLGRVCRFIEKEYGTERAKKLFVTNPRKVVGK